MILRISDLKPNQNYEGCLAVKKAELAQARNSSTYLKLTLTDGMHEIFAKFWNYEGEVPLSDQIIKVGGRVEQYQSYYQMILNSWQEASQDDYDPAEFIPRSSRSQEEMLLELQNWIEKVENTALKYLLHQTFASAADHGIIETFAICPAAISHHHNYLGGLLEHSLEVTAMAYKIASETTCNLDLVITGSLLHDVGKIEEYSWQGTSIKMTERGMLLGHVVLGIMYLNPKILDNKELSHELGSQLLHIIGAHMGKLEWGAIKEPMTVEAQIVHTADLASSELHKFKSAKGKRVKGASFIYSKELGRNIWVGKGDDESE
ncbi:HD domain-containing protein [Bacillota bacterium LX-D]|nr:HD domain-containing protein [Bacillota bacterium LX-D]